MTDSIKIIGAVGGDVIFSEERIAGLLAFSQTDLEHGGTFTGRPGTSLYLGEDSVLKIRNELDLDPRSSERWIRQMLVKEQCYRVHHPHKTWFLAYSPERENPFIGNICPRLCPLHTLLTGRDADPARASEFMGYLNAIFEHYCRVVSECEARLDEGLSNFGVDGQGRVYYLDDDTYPWDRFVSCSHIFGVYFRSMPWLNPEHAAELGLTLRGLMLEHFDDAQYATVLVEQLRDVFVPTESQRQAVESFSQALQQTRAESRRVFKPGNARHLALIADIHGNITALETVLEFLRRENITQGIVLGDIVGYGPYPAECIERIQNTDFMVLKGNHDHGLATGHYQKGFSVSASWVLGWSAERVGEAQKQWLLDLPPVMREEQWIAMHGAPVDPTFFNAYVYEMTYENNLDYMQQRNLPLCFHGHTHLPGVYARRPGRLDMHYLEDNLDLGQFAHCLLCPGSVGQPRNRQLGAQFAVYDLEQRVAHFHLLPYDLDPTLNLMRKEGFPETLIRILSANF